MIVHLKSEMAEYEVAFRSSSTLHSKFLLFLSFYIFIFVFWSYVLPYIYQFSNEAALHLNSRTEQPQW